MMRRSSSPFRPSVPETGEPAVILTDDGGSGLYEACRARFELPDYEVSCDERHTVWVKCVDGSRSLGLSPWLLRQRTIDDIIDSTERKLKAPVTKL